MNKKYTRKRYDRRKSGLGIWIIIILTAIIIAAILIFTGMFKDIFSGKGNLNPSESQSPEQSDGDCLSEDLEINPIAEANPQNYNFETDVMVNGEIVTNYKRSIDILFDKGEKYTNLEGIITFAGNNYRNTFSYGTPTVTEEELERVWEVPTGAIDGWTGSGWTGMPLLVKWPDSTKKVMGMYDIAKTKKDLVEVIYPTMDGNIYFLDIQTGEKTRDNINIGVPTKGTASIDPRGYPILYTGQGIDSVNGKAVSVKFRAINLITNQVMWDFGGKDAFSHRIWQAYDSSALIDAGSDTLIEPGENGVLYTVKLNTKYDEASGTVSVDPESLVKYRYTTPEYGEGDESRWWGIENSIATWRNYAFFTDNGGFLQCVDLNKMELIYSVDVLDDSDTSIVIEEDYENNTFYLYTANEVDKQAGALSSGYGKSYHRKIDGPTGKIIWQKDNKASVGNTSSNGGTLTTPALGKGEISNLIIYAMDMVPIEVSDGAGGTKTVLGGRLIAYDKNTGDVVWSKEQKSDYWSSPVIVYSDTGKAYLVQCDRGGYMKLYNAATGDELYSLDLGSRIDATPSVYGNMIVVGTRGVGGSGEKQKIIGIKIK